MRSNIYTSAGKQSAWVSSRLNRFVTNTKQNTKKNFIFPYRQLRLRKKCWKYGGAKVTKQIRNKRKSIACSAACQQTASIFHLHHSSSWVVPKSIKLKTATVTSVSQAGSKKFWTKHVWTDSSWHQSSLRIPGIFNLLLKSTNSSFSLMEFLGNIIIARLSYLRNTWWICWANEAKRAARARTRPPRTAVRRVDFLRQRATTSGAHNQLPLSCITPIQTVFVRLL